MVCLGIKGKTMTNIFELLHIAFTNIIMILCAYALWNVGTTYTYILGWLVITPTILFPIVLFAIAGIAGIAGIAEYVKRKNTSC